jgi:hypothetical protein
MKSSTLTTTCLLALIVLAACDVTRDVDVNGEVTATQAVSGRVLLEFFETAEGEAAERVSLEEVEIAGLGPFAETLSISEDILIVRAIVDADGDGACTTGEMWGEAQRSADGDGTFAPFAILAEQRACPFE